MITQCPYQIDNNDIGKKTLFACWFLKIIPEIKPTPTTKEIYDFLQSSGVSWLSFQNVCQFLTGKKAVDYISKYVVVLPGNEFDLSKQDILTSFAFAQAVCNPQKIEKLITSLEDETGSSREQWQSELQNKPQLH